MQFFVTDEKRVHIRVVACSVLLTRGNRPLSPGLKLLTSAKGAGGGQ